MLTLTIIALILTIIATILAFIFIVPDSKRARLNKFGKFLHDTFNFKYLIIEKILQALYIFSTIFVILTGFCMLFYVQPGYSYGFYSTPSVWFGGYGILLMLIGPIVIRLSYEFIMMTLLLIKNVIQINNKLKNQNEAKVSASSIEQTINTAVTPVNTPEEPTAHFCTNCGAPVEGGNFCVKCGTKL